MKILKFIVSLLILVLGTKLSFAQLEFTQRKSLFFLGADSIEGKSIVSGVTIFPLDSFSLHLKIEVLDNWVLKDTFSVRVNIDTTSILNSKYFINRLNQKLPAYRFLDNTGFELFIAKEIWHDEMYNSKGEKLDKTYSLSLLSVILSNKRKNYVHTLPIMFEKF